MVVVIVVVVEVGSSGRGMKMAGKSLYYYE